MITILLNELNYAKAIFKHTPFRQYLRMDHQTGWSKLRDREWQKRTLRECIETDRFAPLQIYLHLLFK
jgi:hypothetical protein